MRKTMSRREMLGTTAAIAASTLWQRASLAQSGPPMPKASDDPQYRTTTELVAALQAKKVSASELLEQSIKRIEQLDQHINAVVVRDFDRARAAAKAADEALARGERKPLLGVPMTVKEAYNIAGLPTTWGLPNFKGWTAPKDAVVVTRLKEAGAVILGKTNVPVLLSDWQSYNEIYGTTNNPYDIGRTPGGSSGGSAASLAAGYVSLEMGSDIGGSLRTPAHFTGVYGHKPSYQIVPERGQSFPRIEPIPSRGNGLSVVGPMARSANDIALALDIIAGGDEEGDGVGWRLALPAARRKDLAGYRILLIDTHPLGPTSEDIRSALGKLALRLEKSGAKVMRSHALFPDLAETTRNYIRLLSPVLNQGRPPSYYEQMRSEAAALPADDQSLGALWLRNMNPPYQDWAAANRARTVFQWKWHLLFREVDAVLCPAMPTVAFPHDHSPAAQRMLDVDGTKVPYINNIMWAGFATAGGLPATVAPIDRTQTGLPIGVQIVGPMLEDRTPIMLASLMEREYGGFVPPVF